MRFRLRGLGFRFFGFLVRGLGFRAGGFGCRVGGCPFRVETFGALSLSLPGTLNFNDVPRNRQTHDPETLNPRFARALGRKIFVESSDRVSRLATEALQEQ